MHERAAVVDPHRHGTAVAVVDHRHHGAEWQGAVGGRHGAGVHVLAACGAAVAVDRGEPRSLVAVLGMGARHGRLGMPGAPLVSGGLMVKPGMVVGDPAGAERVARLMKAGIAAAGVVDAGVMPAGVVMRPRVRRPDLKSRRDDTGERPGEGGGLDRTTMRRVMMFQYPFLSRLVALQANRPATPMSQGIKGATFDRTLIGNVG